jgi:hypothetical protein
MTRRPGPRPTDILPQLITPGTDIGFFIWIFCKL